jgi:hypothetical protein
VRSDLQISSGSYGWPGGFADGAKHADADVPAEQARCRAAVGGSAPGPSRSHPVPGTALTPASSRGLRGTRPAAISLSRPGHVRGPSRSQGGLTVTSLVTSQEAVLADLREDARMILTSCDRGKSQDQDTKTAYDLRKHRPEASPVLGFSDAGRRTESIIEAANMPLTCGYITKWSYGDSNPGPLACHPAAGRPPPSIPAGHRPSTSARIPRNPGLLRYFPAVLVSLLAGSGTAPDH